MSVLGLFGGSFDPPHRGHVELARRAKEELGLERLRRARLRRPGPQARRDAGRRPPAAGARRVPRRRGRARRACAHGRPAARAPRVGRPGLPDRRRRSSSTSSTWKEPAEVLRRARLAVATRPGFPREQLDAVLAQLEHPDRVRFFEIEPTAGRLPRAARRASRRARTSPRGARLRSRADPRARASTPAVAGYTGTRLSPIEQARRIAALAQDKLARDVVILDMRPVCAYTDYFVVCTGGNPRQTKAIWDEVHARLKEEHDLLPALGRRRRRGDVDRRRLHRRRAARLHPRGARVLPPRGAVGRRPARDARSSHGLNGHVYRAGNSPSGSSGTMSSC